VRTSLRYARLAVTARTRNLDGAVRARLARQPVPSRVAAFRRLHLWRREPADATRRRSLRPRVGPRDRPSFAAAKRDRGVTVVVTGAAGLLGRHVVSALLAAGRDVRAVDLVRPSVPSTEIVLADLTSLGDAVQALQGASAVVHAAAIPRPIGRTGVEVFRTNVLATYHVVEAALLHGATRLV